MPGRNHLFEEGGYYHIYNKTIDAKKPFVSSRNCQIFEHMIWFYRARKVEVKHSRFLSLPVTSQAALFSTINSFDNRDIDILAYCLMPNHYHFLIQEIRKGGISTFMSKIQNSFTRYYNIKLQRKGQLFLSRFKSKPLESEELLRHVARYIHLNPLSSNLVNSFAMLKDYPYSSLKEISAPIALRTALTTNVEKLLEFFEGEESRYLKFLGDNADYQRTLDQIKKIEKPPIR